MNPPLTASPFALPALLKKPLWMILLAALLIGLAAPARAEEAPDAFIKRLTSDLLDTVKNDPTLKTGDTQRLSQLVDQKVMPHLNFQRMTASAVGPSWRQASPEQKARLQEEFKALLVRTYSGAVSQVKDQSVTVKPLRAAASDNEVLVRTEVRGGAEPVAIDYRLEKTADAPSGWRIYNLNVAGIWLVDTYRTQFGQEINAKGIDGLIVSLSERNKGGARK
jgi:phospholipid transport system substrate-binding protein